MKQGRKEIMADSFYLAKRSVRSPAWAHQLTVTAIEATTSLLLNTPKNHSFLFQEYTVMAVILTLNFVVLSWS